MTDESNGPSDGTGTTDSGNATNQREDTPINITLTGGRGQQFQHIKRALAETLGYEPNNPEVLGLLMSRGDDDDEPLSETDR